MSGLFSLLGMGARSLQANQLAQATVGNNAANAATPGYSRRRVLLTEAPTVRLSEGVFGTGVSVEDVVRLRSGLIDTQRRLSSGEMNYSKAQAGVLDQAQALFGPADESGLATSLNNLFAAFGDLAAHPEDAAVRQTVLARGQSFADAMHGARQSLDQLESDAFSGIQTRISEVNATTARLAVLNQDLSRNPADPDIADQRDRLVDRLAELIGVRATTRPDGSLQVALDGTGILLVDGARAATLTVTGAPTTGTATLTVDGVTLSATRGEVGGLLAARNSSVDGLPSVIANLDSLASGVITAVNRVHASGAGINLMQSVTGSVTVSNPAIPLNSGALGLVPTPVNGSLTLGVFDAAGNFVSSGTVAVNPGVMSLNALAAAISGLPNLTATVTAGQLVVSATNPANRVGFGPDTSDTLAALGVNGFFTGTSAGSIGVSTNLTADPLRIAAAQADFTTGVISPGDARNAQALQALGSSRFLSANTAAPDEFLGTMGAALGGTTQAAQARADVQGALFAAADTQQQSESGVNTDEELADMVRYQHAYEASAHYIRTVDEMIQALLGMMR